MKKYILLLVQVFCICTFALAQHRQEPVDSTKLAGNHLLGGGFFFGARYRPANGQLAILSLLRVQYGYFLKNNLMLGANYTFIPLYSPTGIVPNRNMYLAGISSRYYYRLFYGDIGYSIGNFADLKPTEIYVNRLRNYASFGGGVNFKVYKRIYFDLDVKTYINLNKFAGDNGRHYLVGFLSLNYQF